MGELNKLHSKDILIEVEHVKAHRTEKEKQQMSLLEKFVTDDEMTQFGKFVTDGNENADEPAKEGAMCEGGFMAQARASTILQEREEVYAIFTICCQFSLLGGRMERMRRAFA